MNYWLIIRLPILFAIGVSGGVGVGEGVMASLGWCCGEPWEAGSLGRALPPTHPPPAGQLPHLRPGHLHRGVQTESQSHVQDGHQVQVMSLSWLCWNPQPCLPAETDPGVLGLENYMTFSHPGLAWDPKPFLQPCTWVAPGLLGLPLLPALRVACPRVLGMGGSVTQALVGVAGIERGEESVREVQNDISALPPDLPSPH